MLSRLGIALLLGTLCLGSGCMLLRTNQHWQPFPYEVQRQQLVIHSDSPLTKKDRLVSELVRQRDLINATLELEPTETPIHVYLYADESAYYDFLNLQFPEMSNRRAIFVGSDTQLTVYAYWGDRVAEDLRHEVSHGYLHASVPNLPLWLDEGLAEYFEVGQQRKGFNESHATLLTAAEQSGDWHPRLERLEALSSAADMTQEDYAESWAWVHFLLESTDKSAILTSYLQDLRRGEPGEPLSARVRYRLAVPETALAEHIRTLR